MNINKVFFLIVFVFMSTAYADTLLFNDVEAVDGGISPPLTSFGLYHVEVNFGQLRKL